MPRRPLHVTTSQRDPNQLPDALAPGALVITDLAATEQLGKVADIVRIRRQGGYTGFDIWLWLVLFFCAPKGPGLKDFWLRNIRPHRAQLAALARRRSLPAASSLSRALDAAEHNHVRAAIAVLLGEMGGADVLMRHPALSTYDALGQPYSVFDLDPTVTALRHRALPVRSGDNDDDELPEPLRLAERIGQPGYSGRKRGQLQFRRITVQHAGSGAWVWLHLSMGNGDGTADLVLALDAIVDACKRTEQPIERALVRLDGEYGHVPAMTECLQRKLHFITRLNRLGLLDDDAIRITLRRARLTVVPDSGSGPRRSACELGWLTLEAGERTRRADGSDYEPITVRVIASVYPCPPGGKARSGRLVDGYVVELFATTAPVDGWPCHDVVASFLARAGQENRFAQEDREFGLDRIFSYALPGQELCTVIALSLWNQRIERGVRMAPPAEQPSPEPTRCRVVNDESIPDGWPRDPALLATLDALDWSQLLAGQPDWRYESGSHQLVCPSGRALSLSSVRSPKTASRTRGSLIFIRPRGGCVDCALRESCLRSHDEDAGKHLEVSVAADVAAAVWVFLSRQREQLRGPTRVQQQPIGPVRHGPQPVRSSLFLPARARALYSDALHSGSVSIKVERPAAQPQTVSLMASSRADRQRRRLSWSQKRARNALEATIQPSIHVEVGPALQHAVRAGAITLSA